MSRPPRTTSSGTFFLTAITAQRRRLFQVEATARLFLETLQHYRHQGLYKLHAFVVMPDHVHLLITTTDLPWAMKHIRGTFSHRLNTTREVWQRGYTDHLILTRTDFETTAPTSTKTPSSNTSANSPKTTLTPRPSNHFPCLHNTQLHSSKEPFPGPPPPPERRLQPLS
jgi:putative transposase